MKSARLGYFLFPYFSPTEPTSPAMASLKQCLHYDPDSPQCLKMHRLMKAFDKSFKALDKALHADDWRGVLKLLLGTSTTSASADASGSGSDGFAAKYDAALAELPKSNLQSPQNLYRICQAYRGKGDAANAKEFCARAAEFNGLPQLSYAIVRSKAKAGAAA